MSKITEELEKELEEESIAKKKERVIKQLNSLMRDRITDSKDDYSEVELKTNGITAGYIAKTKGDDKKTYLFKAMKKVRVLHNDNLTPKEVRKLNKDRSASIVELLAAPCFNKMLPSRSPKISTTTDPKKPDEISIKIQFFNNFQTLTQATESTKSTEIDPNHSILQNLDGFTKVIAACIVIGDFDFHGENIGIINDNNNKNKVVKIDHGYSFSCRYESEENLRLRLYKAFNLCGYRNIPFPVTQFKESLEMVLKNLDADNNSDELKKLIDNNMFSLNKNGVKIHSLDSDYISYNRLEYSRKDSKENEILLVKYLIGVVSNNIKKCRDLVRS